MEAMKKLKGEENFPPPVEVGEPDSDLSSTGGSQQPSDSEPESITEDPQMVHLTIVHPIAYKPT